MDPASAAGLALGVTSLALQLLGGCIKGYELFLGISDMPNQYEHLRVRLRLEQTRLLNWGQKTGLLEETLEQPSLTLQLHRNLIVDILSEMQRLFKDCLKIQTKIETVVDSRKGSSLSHLDQLTIPNPGKATLRARAMTAWEKTMEFPTRLQWAAVKQEKLERLVEKMISYNDSIVSLLDRITIQQLYDMQVQSQLTMLQLTTRVEDLHRLASAIKVQTANSTILPKAIQISNSGGDLARLANFKAHQLTLEMGSSAIGAAHIDRKSLLLTDGVATRTLGTYQKTSVWIEWKEYDSDGQVSSAREMIEQRVQKLTTLLSIEDTPEEFRAPHCVGYTHDIDEDTDRYGLVYSIPNATPDAEPTNLLEMIQQTPKPSFTQRITLANTITSSLMYLHSVNWLHKGIRSSNIIFFTSPGQKPDYNTPIISGFEYARPDLPEELTEKPPENFEHDIYRHPDALGRWDNIRSKKSWDIYSLGVVLIEITFWKPIGELLDLSERQKNARSKLRRVRDTLLTDEFLDHVEAEIGGRYRDVVRRCITGGTLLGISEGADEAEPEAGAEMQRVFSELIVGNLRSIQT